MSTGTVCTRASVLRQTEVLARAHTLDFKAHVIATDSVQELLISSDGSSYTALSAGLYSVCTAAELAHGATHYILAFFAVAALGRAPQRYLSLQTGLHRSFIAPR